MNISLDHERDQCKGGSGVKSLRVIIIINSLLIFVSRITNTYVIFHSFDAMKGFYTIGCCDLAFGTAQQN